MDTLSQVLLGVVAVSSLVQALVVLAVAFAGRRLAQDLAEVRARLGPRLTPLADDVQRVARNLAVASDTLAAQSGRVDHAVGATTAALQDTAEYVGRAVRSGVRPLVELGALWQGAKRAVRAYRSLRPAVPRAREGGPAAPWPLGGPHEAWEEQQSEAAER
ncbi:MAG TPA: hypothetical protein VIC87_17895 [Vicinamibacteria bacterium]